MRDGQCRDFQHGLALPFHRRVRQVFLIRGDGLGRPSKFFQRTRAQRHALGIPVAIRFKPRDLDQIRRGRQRRIHLARRRPDLIKQQRALPAQFWFQRLQTGQRFEDSGRAVEIPHHELRLCQQQFPARNLFTARIVFKARWKTPLVSPSSATACCHWSSFANAAAASTTARSRNGDSGNFCASAIQVSDAPDNPHFEIGPRQSSKHIRRSVFRLLPGCPRR